MTPKPGKNLSEVESYRPISLLAIKSKLSEKLILKGLKTHSEEKNLVPVHQFGFRRNHSIDHVHRMIDIIEKMLEIKAESPAVFPDIAQAFNRVWHRDLLHKLRTILPFHFYHLLTSYLTIRRFHVKHKESYSELQLIKADFPQGRELGPILDLLYINDVPTTLNSTMAAFADDKAVIAVGETVGNPTRKLQSA
jgi:hypothetical protein